MNVLVNLSTLKKGGGQNVGLNFINAINKRAFNGFNLILLVANGSELHKTLKGLKFKNLYVTSKYPLIRIFKELFLLPQILKKNDVKIVYTYFGFTLLSKRIIQVCGVAVSNIFYPEVDFWVEYSGISLIKKRIIDAYRLWGIKRAHGLIFENESMLFRAHNLYSISNNKTIYIKPSNYYLNGINIGSSNSNNFFSSNYSCKLLMLCGWQRNKNILRIPEIAFELKKYSDNFEFILSAPLDGSIDHKIFNRLVNNYGVNHMIKLIGHVENDLLPVLFNESSFVLVLSKLESFSNSIIESWVFKRPLIITDAEWSRSICKGAAYYVNRDSPKDIADAIFKLSLNNEMQKLIISNGLSEIKKYPTITERTQMEFGFLKMIYEAKINN